MRLPASSALWRTLGHFYARTRLRARGDFTQDIDNPALAPEPRWRQPLPTLLDHSSASSLPAQDGPSTAIVVLGGGLAGLYAAYHLASGGVPVIVVEREFEPGGLLRGHRFRDHRYSIAEAPLVTTDADLAQDLARLLPPDLVSTEPPPPPSMIRWNGTDQSLPLRLRDLLPGLPPALRSNLILSQLGASFRPGRQLSPSPGDAAEVLRQRYGAPLFQMVIQPDLEHYWSMPLKELAPAAAGFPMREIFSSPAAKDDPPPWSIRCAPHVVAARLAEAICGAGGRIFFGAEVEEVSLGSAFTSHVVIRDRLTPADEPPTRLRISAQGVLSTVPLRSLVRSLGNCVPAQVHASSYYLSYLPVQTHACLVHPERCLDHLTLHFRDRPFLRITEPRHFSLEPQDAPKPSSNLILIEVPGRTPQHSTDVWQSVLEALESEKICERSDIIETQSLLSSGGHPILRRDGASPLERIHECLNRFPALRIAGACGRFACASPVEAMLSARAAAYDLATKRAG